MLGPNPEPMPRATVHHRSTSGAAAWANAGRVASAGRWAAVMARCWLPRGGCSLALELPKATLGASAQPPGLAHRQAAPRHWRRRLPKLHSTQKAGGYRTFGCLPNALRHQMSEPHKGAVMRWEGEAKVEDSSVLTLLTRDKKKPSCRLLNSAHSAHVEAIIGCMWCQSKYLR